MNSMSKVAVCPAQMPRAAPEWFTIRTRGSLACTVTSTATLVTAFSMAFTTPPATLVAKPDAIWK